MTKVFLTKCVGFDDRLEGERLTVFLPTLGGGGAERAMINLAHGMVALGHCVDLVVGNAQGPYRSEVGEQVRLVDLGTRRLVVALPGLVRYLSSARPACVYSALEEANILALWARQLARRPIRMFPSVRNTLSSEMRTNRDMKIRAMIHLARRLYPRADGIIAVSSDAADDAARTLCLPRERITVIANPTITPELSREATAPLHHPWFGSGQPPVILGCGRLVPQKDFATLIEAFALVRQQGPARLVILGEGEQRAVLQQRTAELGVVEDVAMPGFDPNPFRYMARAAVFALSSVFEGSPNVLVQALACGCPVVATDCPSGPREILAKSHAGRLVPLSDAPALASALLAFLSPDVPRPEPMVLPGFDYRTAAAAYLALAGR